MQNPRGCLETHQRLGASWVVGKDAPDASSSPASDTGRAQLPGRRRDVGGERGSPPWPAAYHGLKRKLFCQRGTARLQALRHHRALQLSPENYLCPWLGGRWGLRNGRYFTTGPSVATVHLPSGPGTVKQRRCSCRAQTAAAASRSHPASPEKPCICGDGAGTMEPLQVCSPLTHLPRDCRDCAQMINKIASM